jgi:ribosome recycling factor
MYVSLDVLDYRSYSHVSAYQMLRAVEKALYAAKLPGLTPQRTDARTILLPVSQSTMESRNGLLSGLQKQAEETRVAIRKVHQGSQKHLKAIGFDHKSPATNDVSRFSLLGSYSYIPCL